MPLKFEVESLDGIEESQRPLYVEKDGKFRLDVEGATSMSALIGERNEHKATKAKLSKFIVDGKEIDVGAAQAAMAELEDLKRSRAAGTGNAEESQRIKDLSKQLEQVNARLNAAEQKEQQAQQRLVRTRVEAALDEASRLAGVQEQYRDDVKLRASMFGPNPDEDDAENPIVMLNARGEAVLDDNRVVTPRLWLEGRMAKEKPGWFAESSGGGARGSRGATANGRMVISRDDDAAFFANLKNIKDGKVRVQ